MAYGGNPMNYFPGSPGGNPLLGNLLDPMMQARLRQMIVEDRIPQAEIPVGDRGMYSPPPEASPDAAPYQGVREFFANQAAEARAALEGRTAIEESAPMPAPRGFRGENDAAPFKESVPVDRAPVTAAPPPPGAMPPRAATSGGSPMYELYPGSKDWDKRKGWLKRAERTNRGEPAEDPDDQQLPPDAAAPAAAAAPAQSRLGAMPQILVPGRRPAAADGDERQAALNQAADDFMRRLKEEGDKEIKQERLMTPEQQDAMLAARADRTRARAGNPVGYKSMEKRFAKKMPPLLQEPPPRKIGDADVRGAVKRTVKAGNADDDGIGLQEINNGMGIKGVWPTGGVEAALADQKKYMARPRPDIAAAAARHDIVAVNAAASALKRRNPGLPDVLATELAWQLRNMPAGQGGQKVPGVPDGQQGGVQQGGVQQGGGQQGGGQRRTLFAPSAGLAAYTGGQQGLRDYNTGKAAQDEAQAALDIEAQRGRNASELQRMKGQQEKELTADALANSNSPQMVIATKQQKGLPVTGNDYLNAGMIPEALRAFVLESGRDPEKFRILAGQVPDVSEEELSMAWRSIGRDWEADNAPKWYQGRPKGSPAPEPVIPPRAANLGWGAPP